MHTARKGGGFTTGRPGFLPASLDPAPDGGAGVNHVPRNTGLELVSGGHCKQADPGNLAAYRPYTRALLRRYFRMAVDIGRLPSILGGLCFRARVSSYKLNTFEDAVIFVHDIERVFERVERHYLEI